MGDEHRRREVESLLASATTHDRFLKDLPAEYYERAEVVGRRVHEVLDRSKAHSGALR